MDTGSHLEITRWLHRWVSGDKSALEHLTPLVYDSLCRLAHLQLRHEPSGHTLETSALVHEAYFRLVDQSQASWRDRTHFLSLASRMMRRILVDHARRRNSEKRGGRQERVPLEHLGEGEAWKERSPDLVELDEALDRLAQIHPEAAKVVDLRYFGGLSGQEIARCLEISTASVTRRWRLARAWLFQNLHPGVSHGA